VTVASNNGHARGSQAPVVLEGRKLDYALRHKSARTREKVARDLIDGRVNVGRFNRRQAAAIARVSYAKLSKKPTQPLSTMLITFAEVVCNVLGKLSDEELEREISDRDKKAIIAEYARVLQAKQQTLK
jgi:hypothetical protein